MANQNHHTPSLVGGILLVIGNVIGAGILALPIATAQLGLCYAILMLFFFWTLMMLGAYYFLEANLALPSGSNLISMSRTALGKTGTFIAWVCNLLVMYSLISAYIAGGADLIKVNFHYLGITLPYSLAALLFLLLFGFIISRGIHITDYINRILMLFKAAVFFVVLMGLGIHFNTDFPSMIPQKNLSASLLIIVLTSFGFATLVPSLRRYYQSDIKKIKKIIFWGTLIPFLCYTIWIVLIFSVLPYHGPGGLEQMSTSPHPVSDLQLALTQSLHLAWITQVLNIFSAICVITSFLANSISLTDFIAEGLYSHHENKNSWNIYLMTYLPPFSAVLFYPKAFLFGLSLAGKLAIIQLLLLPGLIVWCLRYRQKKISSYQVKGGKVLLISLLIISFIILLLSMWQ